MKKSIIPICDYYTYTPEGNIVVVFKKEQDKAPARKYAAEVSIAAGMLACSIAAFLMIPYMMQARGAFRVGGEFLFCVAVGIVVGKVAGKIYEFKARS